jgi:thioredoxin-related protein
MVTFFQLRCVAMAMLLLASGAGTAAGFDDTAVARFSYPDWFKTTFYDLGDDLADAREAGKSGILLFFTTTGCSYCKKMLDGSFADPLFAAGLRERYDVIGLEIFSDSEITDWAGQTRSLSDFARAQGVQFSPTLVFLDLDGRRLLRLVGYYDTAFLKDALAYLDSGAATRLSLRDWRAAAARLAAPEKQTEPLITDPLFANPPYQLDRRHIPAGQPLMVLFAEKGCVPCTDFHHGVLSEPAIRDALDEFEVVRLDTDDDTGRLVAPDGRIWTAAAWHHELGFSRLPAFAVFDEQGKLLVQTDALVLRGRFDRMLSYVLQRVYEKGWSFQRYARSESIRQLRERQTADAEH